jgi:dsDNA-specific endonuclease/ATPase MutS2
MSEKIKIQATRVREIPKKLDKLESELLLLDFCAGISRFLQKQENLNLPEISNLFEIIDSKNIFLNNAQDISFLLDAGSKCSILTGANSGGKTTLLEHLIQIIVLANIGLPISGKIKLPGFSEIYYFAKSKGSTNKGAFETLLTQMSKIQPKKSNETLILADEIESVTEPGVAGKILCATSDYFIQRGCFLVIATHLGQEIKPHLPRLARIDGIEAQGLDENFNLIVHHNPILGKLAHSTPELIVEKMAKSNGNDYLKYLWEYMKTR